MAGSQFPVIVGGAQTGITAGATQTQAGAEVGGSPPWQDHRCQRVSASHRHPSRPLGRRPRAGGVLQTLGVE